MLIVAWLMMGAVTPETHKKESRQKMDNYTVENCTVMGEAQKRNFAKLPKVKYFRVQSRGAVGTLNDLHERKVGGWAILVALENGNGLRLASDVALEFGMKFKCEYATKEDAFKAAMDFKAKWGMPTSAKGKKTEEEKAKAVKAATEEAVGKIVAALKAMGLSDEAVRAIVAKAN